MEVGGRRAPPDPAPPLPRHLRQLQSFDKGMPQPKSRAEEKKQKAEQLANLLRIQKELTSDYKVWMSLQSVCARAGGQCSWVSRVVLRGVRVY